jgi:hypothetical protein
MSVAFPSTRNDLPDLTSIQTSLESRWADHEHGGSASRTWSFCSGQDRELPLLPDEEINLINLRSAGTKYGAQPIDGKSDTEEAGRSCEIPCSAGNLALAVGITVMDLIVAAGVATANAVLCSQPDKVHSDIHICILPPLLSVPVVVGAFGLTVVGLRRLIDAYGEGNNSQGNPNA